MSAKFIVMLGMVIGSILGSLIPTFFGADFLSMSSLAGNGIGGLLGIYIAYRLTQL